MRSVITLLVLALSAPLAGCFTCQPQLDVHQCRNETGRCELTGEVVADWNPDIRELFPDIDRLVNNVMPGEHGHADWTKQQAAAFWQFYHVPQDRSDKQVYLRHDGGLYHVRILDC